MRKKTNENEKQIKEKLEYLGLDLDNIPEFIKKVEPIKYKPLKMYEETSYKIYKYIDVKDIQILITPKDRLDDLTEKYKKSSYLIQYLTPNNEENIDKYSTFLKMLNELDIEKLKELEKEQKQYNKEIPYEIKYNNNFAWQIFYSQSDDKYFMLFPSNETQVEVLFYLIKKQIQAHKSRRKELIYAPICAVDYSGKYLKTSEIADLENYIWLFTNQWPNIYEVYDKNEKMTLQIIGNTNIYEKIQSIYKMKFENKLQAQEYFKVIKALFILQVYDDNQYKFNVGINENGELEFSYNFRKITYGNLSEFINEDTYRKHEKINRITENIMIETESLELLKETVNKQNQEYLLKEKQIVTFLECKKTFFGKMKYFFKGKKTKKTSEEKISELVKKMNDKDEKDNNLIQEEIILENKENYTVEDLLYICKILDEKQTKYNNILMDKKALENKRENLERKIKNATSYINEIESHKKSIFDFWKYTSKDEVSLLNESEEHSSEKENKIKKVFDYEEDIEDFASKMDEMQRTVFSKSECDAFFAIKNDIQSFNILSRENLRKKDEIEIEKQLKKIKQEYKQNIEEITARDFDIFGNVIEDKTKIKVLNNSKHREIEKDKYKVLGVNLETELQQYIENIKNYRTLIKESYGKIQLLNDISAYKLSLGDMVNEGYEIFNMDVENEIKYIEDEDILNLFKINLKENTQVILYTNIMFFDNYNNTLPKGMDVSKQILIDMDLFEPKLVSRKDFQINVLKNEFENSIKKIQLYEYDMERKI